MKLVLSLQHNCHKRLVMFEKRLAYQTPEGWALVLFDVNGDYYTPSETFATEAEANAFGDAGLKDGVFIS